MKIKLNENLTTRLVAILERQGHEVDTVVTEGLMGKPDVDVWASARREGRFFITQDLDFSDIRQFQPGTHPGLLLVRLRERGCECFAGAHQRGGSSACAGVLVRLFRRAYRPQAPHQTAMRSAISA